jgi:hypothetical protein
MEPVDGAPCFFSGSLTLGGCGLPSTDRLADCFVAGNGKIQGGLAAIADASGLYIGIEIGFEVVVRLH